MRSLKWNGAILAHVQANERAARFSTSRKVNDKTERGEDSVRRMSGELISRCRYRDRDKSYRDVSTVTRAGTIVIMKDLKVG